jgi:hypothetical protein
VSAAAVSVPVTQVWWCWACGRPRRRRARDMRQVRAWRCAAVYLDAEGITTAAG